MPNYVTIGNTNNTLRSSIKCVKQSRSPNPQQTTESITNIKTATKRQNENSQDQSQQQSESVKRPRLLSRPSDDNSINTNRIVLRIRKPSEDLSSSRSETSNGSNGHQLTVQIKEPLVAVKEDDEKQNETQTINVFDIFNQTSILEKKDDE